MAKTNIYGKYELNALLINFRNQITSKYNLMKTRQALLAKFTTP